MEKKRQRGVTLLETVIALALIVIVTGTVFVTCNVTLRSQAQSKIKNFFIGETENVVMCYYSDDFESALGLLLGESVSNVKFNEETGNMQIYYSEDFEVTQADGAVYLLEMNTKDIGLPSVTCTKISSGTLIYSYGGANENA